MLSASVLLKEWGGGCFMETCPALSALHMECACSAAMCRSRWQRPPGTTDWRALSPAAPGPVSTGNWKGLCALFHFIKIFLQQADTSQSLWLCWRQSWNFCDPWEYIRHYEGSQAAAHHSEATGAQPRFKFCISAGTASVIHRHCCYPAYKVTSYE